MATTLTKDQVRNLSAEQQEAFAVTEVQRIRSRQQLLERTRRGMSVWTGLWTGLALGLAGLCVAVPRVLPFAIIAAIALMTFHTTRLHRRLDALTELLEASEKEHGNDARAASDEGSEGKG